MSGHGIDDCIVAVGCNTAAGQRGSDAGAAEEGAAVVEGGSIRVCGIAEVLRAEEEGFSV